MQSFPKWFVHFWMTFCKNSIRISCQIVFVNKHWSQSCPGPFKFILWLPKSQIYRFPSECRTMRCVPLLDLVATGVGWGYFTNTYCLQHFLFIFKDTYVYNSTTCDLFLMVEMAKQNIGLIFYEGKIPHLIQQNIESFLIILVSYWLVDWSKVNQSVMKQ